MKDRKKPDVITLKIRMAWVDGMARDRRLQPIAFKVASVIGTHLNWVTGYAFVSHATIAKETGRSRSAVCDAIQALIGSGYLLTHSAPGRGGVAYRYSIGRVAPVTSRDGEGELEDDKGGAEGAEREPSPQATDREQPVAKTLQDLSRKRYRTCRENATGPVAKTLHQPLYSTHPSTPSSSSAHSASGERSRRPKQAHQTALLLPLPGGGLAEKVLPRRFARGNWELLLAEKLGLAGGDWVEALGRLDRRLLDLGLRRLAAGTMSDEQLLELKRDVDLARVAASQHAAMPRVS